MKLRSTLYCLLLSFLFHPSAFPQGQLPPPSPPGPTMKSLDQLDEKLEKRVPIDAIHTPGDASAQFRIGTQGSYYLTGNILPLANKDGISVEASGVTIDLNGFVVGFNPNSPLAGSGVGIKSFVSTTTVRNGSVHGWAGGGLRLGTAARVESVSVAGNGDGIYVQTASVIVDSVTRGNQGTGIAAGYGSVIRNCTAVQNGGQGIRANGSHISHCAAVKNGGDGIAAAGEAIVENNTCDGNGTGTVASAGISASGNGNRIENNNTTNNDVGISVTGTGTVIEANHVRNNTGPGIEVTTVNGRNVIIRNVAGNNVNSYTSIASGNQVGPIDTNFTATSPFANFGN